MLPFSKEETSWNKNGYDGSKLFASELRGIGKRYQDFLHNGSYDCGWSINIAGRGESKSPGKLFAVFVFYAAVIFKHLQTLL